MQNRDAIAVSSATGPGMLERRQLPDLGNVIVGVTLILIGIPLAMSLLFIFIGAPLVMAGVELLTTPSNR